LPTARHAATTGNDRTNKAQKKEQKAIALLGKLFIFKLITEILVQVANKDFIPMRKLRTYVKQKYESRDRKN